MKDQASLNLLIVDSPIDSKALTGHLMLRATSDGLKVYDNTGVETPIGGEVDESRLLPTGGRNGNLLEYQEGADRGNNVNTKLLLQPATSDGLIVDQAAGNAAPVSITNSGNVVIEDNALVFTGANSLLIPANALGMTLGGNNEFMIDIEFQLDSVKSDYATLYGSDGGGSGYQGALYFTSGGAAQFTMGLGPSTTGWTLGTKHRITIERWNDNGTWKTSVYRNGSFLASSTSGMNTLSDYVFPIGSNTESTNRNFIGKIWAFRISNKAEHRGVSFTPRELPFLPPAGQPVWTEGIDRSRLLPEDPANGDIPCYNATATTGGGNDVNTKVLLHFDELPFADTAAGNASPAAVTNSGVTLDTENFKFGTASAKFANSPNNLKVAVPQAQMMASPWLADCWFKVDDGQWSEYSRIFTQDDEQNGGWTYYLMSGNRVGVWVRNVTPDEPASAALTPGDWHYAALVYHDSKFYGFIDGVRFTVQDGSAEGFLNYIMLGKRIQSTSYSLRGNIDEFRFQLLDEAEIGKWTGTTIPVPTTPYSIQETAGEWGKFNKSELVKSVNGQTPDSSGAVTLPEATTSAAGLMAATDKAKLDKFGESDGKLTYDGAEIGGGGISEIAVGTGLSGTGITSDPLNLNIANYTSQSTISLSSTEGSVNLAGHNSVNLQETFGNKLTLAERGIVITTASGADVLLNEHASNSPSGFVILDSTGKLPAVDGSQLTNLPAGAVDLSAYTGGISLNSTNDSAVAIKFNSGNPTYNAELSMSPAGVTLSGYGDVSLEHTGGSYLRLTSGEATLSSNASLTLSAGSRLTISASEGIYLGAAGLNTAGGLVKVGDDGKIPSSLYDAGTGGDTSALETRVTTLETTVGTLNTTVDEILADYGEGSGALVYRVVASATEPENPTEGMLWIKTE